MASNIQNVRRLRQAKPSRPIAPTPGGPVASNIQNARRLRAGEAQQADRTDAEQDHSQRLGDRGREGQIDLVALLGNAEIAAAEAVAEGSRIDRELGRVEAADPARLGNQPLVVDRVVEIRRQPRKAAALRLQHQAELVAEARSRRDGQGAASFHRLQFVPTAPRRRSSPSRTPRPNSRSPPPSSPNPVRRRA